jgi:Zn-dependent protease with chaperone function
MTTAAERILFHDISPTAWEHPSDRAALNALRKVPGFDVALRKLFSLLGEKQVRLAFRANAVKVTSKQYGWVHEALLRACEILDVEDPPEVFVSQTPIANAGAYGLDKPFIILNSSLIEVLEKDELEAVLGHELGHVLSGHALYRTMLYLLLQLTFLRWTPAGLAVRPLVLALLEWSRKAEVSCDRAGALVAQDPRVQMSALMKLAGGARHEELDLDEFVAQSDEYMDQKGFLDRVYKALALMGATHPFAVLRVAELRMWVDASDYERIIGGDYRRRSEDDQRDYLEDLVEAGKGYATKAESFLDSAEAAFQGLVGRITDAWRSGEPGDDNDTGTLDDLDWQPIDDD